MTYIMKRIFTAAAAAALCLSLFAGCGDGGSSSAASSKAETKASGNAAPFNLSESHIKGVLACAWVNQNDLNEKIKFGDDLSFTHYIKGDRYQGKATLDEKGGLLTLTYDNDAFAEKAYVWVDSLGNVNSNTWYVDGGTFAFGGKTFIKDVEF